MRRVRLCQAAVWVCACCAPLVLAPPLRASPILQLYAEGATYDTVTESWYIEPVDGEPLIIWAIGNVDGPGGHGPILNVRLAVSYSAGADTEPGGLGIELVPTTTGGFGGFTDPSTPTGTGTFIQKVTDGSVPQLGDGSDLPSHGVYGPGVVWQEFLLGDFTLIDSPIADFIDSFPLPSSGTPAQINAYEVRITNSSTNPTQLHFDLYDTYVSGTKVKAVFAPFSHDLNVAPEPASLAVWLVLGGVGAVAAHRRRRRAAQSKVANQ